MILKRKVLNEKIKAVYSSSNIAASVYDTDTKDLTLIFNNGGQYLYPAVTETDYTRFETADSQGVIFNSHIKKYKFEKLDAVDISELLKEISELKQVDDKVLIDSVSKDLLADMNGIIGDYLQNGSLSNSRMIVLEKNLTKYKSIITPVTT